jgi:vacuolar-type H+-ATPase subunit C/Vma6
LLTRLSARRAAVAAAWSAVRVRGLAPGVSDERIWQGLLAEFEWLYGQMDRALRRRVGPVFVLFELKTIVLCVRNKAAHRTLEIDGLLARSLLGAPLRHALKDEPSVRATIAAVTAVIGAAAPSAREAADGYASGGLRGFEDGLMRGYLAHVATATLDATVGRFFALFTDLRNVMILYKQMRWGIADPAAFIRGGTLEPVVFERALASKERAAIADLAERATGLKALPPAETEGSLETVLLSTLSRRLHQAARTDGAVAVIVDYVWRKYAEARNSAVLLHGAGTDVIQLEGELIA